MKYKNQSCIREYEYWSHKYNVYLRTGQEKILNRAATLCANELFDFKVFVPSVRELELYETVVVVVSDRQGAFGA